MGRPKSKSSSRSGILAIRAVVENMEPRVLLAGQISGAVWQDLNKNGVRDAGEPTLSGWTVYLDQNHNGKREAGETSQTTDASGAYRFAGLAAGTYYVAVVTPLGWQVTSPGAGGAVRSSSVATLQASYVGDSLPITYTGSNETMYMAGGSDGQTFSPSDLQSGPLINLNAFRADPRFSGIDGTGYSIAVLDTGIDRDSPFFGPDSNHDGIDDRIVYQYDFANGDNDASDRDGHGSNVASIAAGHDTTNDGMAPGANIIALKIFSDSGSGRWSDLEKALQWCVANADAYNLVAINMSIGDSANYNSPQQLYGISDELAALAAKNIMIVSAAGNSYYDYQTQGVSYPAADPNSLAVGAVYDANVGSMYYADGSSDYTTAADRIASFSQRSTAMGVIFAPGALITGAGPTGGTLTEQGTSQASPHIAGIAVLAQQLAMQRLGRRLTMTEFRTLLQTTGVTINDGDDENDNVINTGVNFKRVDVLALANAIDSMGVTEPYGYVVNLTDTGNVTNADFGVASVVLTPGKPDLNAAYDTGVSSTDNITSNDNSTPARLLQFTVPGTIAGTTVRIYASGVLIGQAAGLDGQTVVSTSGSYDLADGVVSITARQFVTGLPESADSPALSVAIDTAAPIISGTPDLQPGSDSGISSTDNLTNVAAPIVDVGVGDAGILHLLIDGLAGATQSVGGPGVYGLKISSAAATFSAQQRVSSGAGVYAVAVGDVNGDGVLDLLAANSVVGALTVSLGNGDGTFRLPVATLRPRGPYGVAAADFNGDGKADVVLTDNTASVSVLLGRGDGTFGSEKTLACTTGNSIVDVAVGDVNGDRNSDVIVMERGSRTIRVFLGDGKGGFGAGTSFAVGGQNPFDPQLADVNGDGKTDVIVPDSSANTVSVLLGNGSGGFAAPLATSVGENPTGLGVGDFDGDGTPDLMVVENGAWSAHFMRGKGDGTFVSGQQFAVNYNNTGGVAADFNLDGNMDFATTASSGTGSVDVLYGNGDGTFQPYKEYAIGKSPYALAGGDLNGDGRTDLVSANYSDGDLSVLLASGGQLSDGVHRIAYYLTDLAGNTSAVSGDLTITLDTVAPAAPGLPDLLAACDSGLSNSDNITNASTLDIAFSSSPYFRFYRNGALLSGSYQSGTGFSDSPADGTWTYTVAAVDAAGNVSAASTALVVTKDTVAPAQPPAPTLAGASGTGDSSAIADPVLNTSASPYFRLFADGSQISGDYESGGSYHLPAQTLGDHHYSVQAVDAAGNVSTMSNDFLLHITPPAPAQPRLPAACDSGLSSSDAVTNFNNSPGRLLQFLVDGTLAGATVNLYVDGVLSGSVTSAGGTVAVSLDGSALLADGVHLITAKQMMAGKSDSPLSAALTLTVDTIAPSGFTVRLISDSGVSSTDNITNASTPDVSVLAADSYRLLVDGSQVATGLGSGAIRLSLLSDGVHHLSAIATDLAGNQSAEGGAIDITIDTVAPAQPVAPQLQAGSDSGISNSDNVTNVASPVFDVAGASPYFRFYRNGALVSGLYESGGNYTLAAQADGGYSLAAVAVDAAGNVSPLSATTTILIDTQAPTVSWGSTGADASGWNHADVSLPYTVSDSRSGVAGTSAGSLAFTSEGAKLTQILTVADRAGNSASYSSPVVNLDKTAPLTTPNVVGTLGASGWYRSAVQVTLDAADAFSGASSTWYQLDGGALQQYSGAISVSGDGVHSLSYYSLDKAGNSELTRQQNIAIDTVAPASTVSSTGTTGNSGWYRSAATVTLKTTDATSSPDSIWYQIDNGPTLRYDQPFVVSDEGTHTIRYYSLDRAGNTERTQQLTLKVDTTPPAMSWDNLPPAWSGTSVVLNYSLSDKASLVSGPAFGSLVFNDEGANQTRSFTVSDRAGNTVTYTTPAVNIDLTAPVSQIVGLPTYASQYEFPVSWGATDGGSGVANYDIYVNDNRGVYWLWQDHTTATSAVFTGAQQGHVYSFYSVARDAVGNEEVRSSPTSLPITVRVTTPAGGIAVSPAVVLEKRNAGEVVGTLSAIDPVAGGIFSYSLVPGTGSTDNASFKIVGNQLLTNARFAYDVKNSYSIRVRLRDQGEMTIDRVLTVGIAPADNRAPTGLSLAPARIAENQPIGSVVGSFTAADPNLAETFTYNLISTATYPDNAMFTISGNQLKTAAAFNFESRTSYSICVRVRDHGGLTFQKVFTVKVANVNEAPTRLKLSSLSIAENLPGGSAVGTLSATDPDAGSTLTYSLADGDGSVDNAAFAIVGNQLMASQSFDFEARSLYSIRLRATDQGGLFCEKAIIIGVTNVNEAPTALTLSNYTVLERQPAGTVVGLLTGTDPDAGNTLSYSLVIGTGSKDNALFTISGRKLKTAAAFDFKTRSVYKIRVRVTDQNGLWYEKAMTINIVSATA